MNFRGWQLHERILAPITLVVFVAAVIMAWFGSSASTCDRPRVASGDRLVDPG
jgi:hypothetical protein